MTSPSDPGLRLAGVQAGRRHQAIAEALLAPERDRAPIASLVEQSAEADIRDACSVSLELVP